MSLAFVPLYIRYLGIEAYGLIGIFAILQAWLASDWLKSRTLPTAQVAQAVAIMGVVSALRFIESIYDSTLVGLQRQVLENVVASVMATVRSAGAVAVLAVVAPTIQAFFIWQGVISVVSVILLAAAVYRTLPAASRPARFSLPALLTTWRFAAGMMVITGLALLLTQVDKILLSRLPTLQAFGYYALAGTVATAPYMLSGPIGVA